MVVLNMIKIFDKLVNIDGIINLVGKLLRRENISEVCDIKLKSGLVFFLFVFIKLYFMNYKLLI